MSRVNEILDFWFGRPQGNEAEYGKRRAVWFVKNPEFDQEIQTRFRADYEEAAAGKLDDWKESPQGCLALILLFDQFPRNMFRGDPQTFATDSQALSVAQHAIAQSFDQELIPVQRWFMYLPFEHSENLEHQYRAVELFRQLGDDPDSLDVLSYAIRHRDVIERFGRFPHRNKILGRPSTPEEAEFLKQPGSSF
jgi:uncharacterized protein (DUF924 family)